MGVPLGQVLGAAEERRAHAHHGEHVVLLDELLGHGEVGGGAPLVVFLVGQLELAPVHAALGIDHGEVGLHAVHDRGEVGRQRPRDVGDAAHVDQGAGHPGGASHP